jgi:tubulin polyglutamylase TTLL6/13
MIDRKGKPWLIEINHAPSLNTDTEIDEEVKVNLLKDTFNLVNITTRQKLKFM